MLGYPAVITRIPGSKSWVKGLANVRGQLLPMIDLRQFLGSGATAPQRNTRVVVVNHREIPAGLIVDEVLGFRRFAEPEFNAEAPPTVIRCDSLSGGGVSPRRRSVAGAESEEPGREPELPAGRELNGDGTRPMTRERHRVSEADAPAGAAGARSVLCLAAPRRSLCMTHARRPGGASAEQFGCVLERIPFEAQNALRGDPSTFDALAKSMARLKTLRASCTPAPTSPTRTGASRNDAFDHGGRCAHRGGRPSRRRTRKRASRRRSCCPNSAIWRARSGCRSSRA